jgi:DNA-binding CsgD family transcriptional regulator
MKRDTDSANYRYIPSESRDELVLFNRLSAAEDTVCLKDHSNKTLIPFSNCLIDISGRQFACIHEECSGHTDCAKTELVDVATSYHGLQFHPEDKTVLCQELFPDILGFMKNVPADELEDYRFSFNHRYLRKDGSSSQFLQEGTLSVSEDLGIPVLSLKVFTETGDIKTDESMVLTISRYDPELGYKKVFSKSYQHRCKSVLSQRELEIIRLCLEGLSSKMVADKLNISIHTVKNHKRNSMEKTCTRNIAELIHVCLKSQWL